MASQTWEQDKINLLKLSNEESHSLAIESIETALLQLMRRKEFDAIRVSDIVRRSGVSRSAFYKNYSTKEDVLQQLIERNMEDVMQYIRTESERSEQTDFWQLMFEALSDRSELFETICHSGKVGMLYDVFNTSALKSLHLFEEQNAYFMLFYVGGVANVVINWIIGGMKENAAEMSRILNIMISDH